MCCESNIEIATHCSDNPALMFLISIFLPFSSLRSLPLQIGDRVMAFVNYNAWAEVVCAPVDFVYKMPDRMTFAEAAAFSLNFVAAYMMLFEVANLREGMSVLVHSAGGGVVSVMFISILPHKCVFYKCDQHCHKWEKLCCLLFFSV